MRQVTATGQTVDDAVQSALEQLNTSRDHVNVEIIDEGKKGLFGIFGTKRAIVKVTLGMAKEPNQVEESDNTSIDDHKEERDYILEAKNFLIEIADKMEAPIDVKVKRNGKEVEFDLSGEKIALLIGKRGQTLNSLQYLTHLVVNRQTNQYYTVVVDAENYRERRKETLTQLAGRLAIKAVKTKKSVALEPMPSYERKIIHTALQNRTDITTHSDGMEPHRHVVIKPVK